MSWKKLSGFANAFDSQLPSAETYRLREKRKNIVTQFRGK